MRSYFLKLDLRSGLVIKSAGNVALTTAGIAIGGALGAKHLEASGSLIGMGLGAIVGNKLSNQLQTSIG